ncbi:MAG: exopolysaccharide biosynthesis polyprenyl glycosylphosphotransferase [Terriglobales bacterium]
MAASLPVYVPRRRAWQFALSESGLILLVLSAVLCARFGRDALVLLRTGAALPLVPLCLLALLCFYGFDFYAAPQLSDWRCVWRRLPLAAGVLALQLAWLEYTWPALRLTPGWGMETVTVTALVVAAFRPLVLAWARHRRRQAVLVVGAGPLADALCEQWHRHTELGLPLAGRLSRPHPVELQALVGGAGGPWARRLLAAFPGGWEAVAPELRRQLQTTGCELEDGRIWYERLSGQVPLAPLAEAPVSAPLPGLSWRAGKRAVDCGVAGVTLVLTAPLMLLLALLIRLDSPGPALFRQQRVGRGGRLFTLFKFRSMYCRTDAGEALPAQRHDPRCTRLGRWLRRLRLDELPQLLNILRGEMSLVGPRPFVPEQERQCLKALDGYALRWRVLPGATGWAQVNRGYCVTLADNAEKLGYDLFYIKHLSLWFDFMILIQTAKVVFLGRGGQ